MIAVLRRSAACACGAWLVQCLPPLLSKLWRQSPPIEGNAPILLKTNELDLARELCAAGYNGSSETSFFSLARPRPSIAPFALHI